MIEVLLRGDKALIGRLQSIGPSVQASLVRKVHALSLKLQNYIQTKKLSGQVLSRKSGRLMRSINQKVEESARAVYGIVSQSSDVPYGRIHEYGGKTAAHLIVPKKASVLAFNWKGEHVFFRRVNHPGSTMPERSYMRSGLRDMSVEISTGLKMAVIEGIEAAR